MRVLFAGLFLCVALACNDATTEVVAPERNRVLAEAAAFTPPSVPVRVGGTVEFAFGPVAHQVIFDEMPGRPDHIQNLLANTVEARQFPVAGTYPYRCEAEGHGEMRGQVVVSEVSGTNPG